MLNEAPRSLLPGFGTVGCMLDMEGKGGHKISGWLPKSWLDNSRWAAVTATYTQLVDVPEEGSAAVRIDVQKVDEGQLQLTTFTGNYEYKKGVNYAITGWVRSASRSMMKAGVRSVDESHVFYNQVDLEATPDWKLFEVIFTPESDCEGWVMFVMKEAGSVDLAGIAVNDKS